MTENNRSLLLATALHLFAERGYDAVGVQEIVEAVHLTKPTLYHYFGSKTGLLQAILDGEGQVLSHRLAQASAYHGDLPQTLFQVATTYFEHARNNSDWHRLQLALWFAPPESDGHRLSAALHRRLFAQIEHLFEQAAAQHGNMRGRQQLYATTFLGLLNNCIGLALDGSLTLDEALTRRIVHQFQHGIYS